MVVVKCFIYLDLFMGFIYILVYLDKRDKLVE